MISQYSQKTPTISQYDPTYTPQQSTTIQTQIPDLNLGKWDKKWVACCWGIIISVIGFFITYFTFTLFYFEPLISIFFAYFTIIVPLMGTVLIGMGYFKSGGVLLIIGCILLIPIGLIGIFGIRIAFKLGKAEKYFESLRPQLGLNVVDPFKKPNMVIRSMGAVIIIICIILPSIFYWNYIDQPQLKIDEVDGTSFLLEGSATVTVKLINVGLRNAKGEDIEIRFQLTEVTRKSDWNAGDVNSKERVKETFEIYIGDTDLESVSIYYKGVKSHEVFL